MKTFGYYDNLAKRYKLINEQEVGAHTPLAGQISPDSGTEQKDLMKPDKETENVVDALKQIINIAQTALDKKNDHDEDKNNKDDLEDKDDQNDVVTRPNSDGAEDIFGKQEA